MNDIKVWAQMFFDDGSVSEGVRISHVIFDDQMFVNEIALKLLNSLNRDLGLLLIWGAGEIKIYECDLTACLSEESETSASLLWSALPPEQN